MTGPDIEIRAAVIENAATLSAVGGASFRAAYGGTASAEDLLSHVETYFSVTAIEKEFVTAGRRYLVASIDGEATGFVKIREGERPAVIPGSSALELQQVYVLPDKQRYGVGGRLIEAVVDIARSESADGLWLSVWEDAPWAVNAYRKNGFEAVGTAAFRLGKTRYKDVLMWRSV
ncbi:MAG: GNAT family N-acetyltransferase [Desulfobulbaceae bacterium]|nr:GNAT family N-acetyltransferase [Desulfobulbaceae bacterium]